MVKIKWTALILLTVSFVQAFSAPISKEYQRQFKQAMIYVQNEEYKDALPVLAALNKENNNANLDFHIGLCNYYLQFDKREALASFDKAVKNIAKKYTNTATDVQAPNEAVYFQALCYHYLAETDKAIAKYEEYLKNAKEYSSDKLIIADAKRKLKIAKETPSLFAMSEHNEIVAGRATTKKLEKSYTAKLKKVMDIIQDDKIEALLLLKGMLKEYPNEPNINYMMGICLLNIKPYNELATDYFTIADKNSSSFKESGIGLDCPAFVKYYSGVANQVNGNHKQALADFEAFNAVYPEDYASSKPEFIKHMEYSRNMLKNGTPQDSAALASYNNQMNIIDTAGVSVLFPILGTPIANENNNHNKTNTTFDSEYYYSVQVGAGNMKENHFNKVNELRTSKYPNGIKRFLTGKFPTKEEATARMKELVDFGYSDAYVTRMRGKK